MKKWVKLLKAAVLPLLLLAGWQVAYMSGHWSAYVLPSPSKVWTSFSGMVKDGVLLKHIAVSFRRVAVGYAISFLLAFTLAVVAFIKEGAEDYYGSLLEFMRNVPPISLIALLILWFGIWRSIQDHYHCTGLLFSHVFKYEKRAVLL